MTLEDRLAVLETALFKITRLLPDQDKAMHLEATLRHELDMVDDEMDWEEIDPVAWLVEVEGEATGVYLEPGQAAAAAAAVGEIIPLYRLDADIKDVDDPGEDGEEWEDDE
ncbi:MAG: hypothetical protein ACO3CU_11650 [Candidatus Nanopelagicales bacterium]